MIWSTEGQKGLLQVKMSVVKKPCLFPTFPKNNYRVICPRCRGDRYSEPPVQQACNLSEMLLNNNMMDRD